MSEIVPEACCARTLDIDGYRAAVVPPTTRTPALCSWFRNRIRLPSVGWPTYHEVVFQVSLCTGNGERGPMSQGTYVDFQPVRVRVHGSLPLPRTRRPVTLRTPAAWTWPAS